MKILFWGTPDFAVPALAALLGEGHEVVGVVTQPDRPAGRSRELREPPVKTLALDEGIPVLQPERPAGPAFLAELRALEPDVSVVVAYGRILARDVLELPAHGSLNLHASLLPALRGAAPINWAIVNGLERTGVTIMRMVERMDAGPILLQVEEPIGPEENAGDLWARLSEIGAEALVEALALLELGELDERPQDEAAATYAPKLEHAHARIDWSRSALEVSRLIRGFDPVPGAWTLHRGEELKLFRPRFEDDAVDAAPGSVVRIEPSDPAQGVLVACGEGALWLREVTPPGKRRMTAAEWARGRGVASGDTFA